MDVWLELRFRPGRRSESLPLPTSFHHQRQRPRPSTFSCIFNTLLRAYFLSDDHHLRAFFKTFFLRPLQSAMATQHLRVSHRFFCGSPTTFLTVYQSHSLHRDCVGEVLSALKFMTRTRSRRNQQLRMRPQVLNVFLFYLRKQTPRKPLQHDQL